MAMTNKLNYSEFFTFPQIPPTSNEQCVAVCKVCSREYKYSLNTKGNLNHHISNSHPAEYKAYFDQKVSISNDSNQQSLPTLVTINEGSILDFTSFHRQDSQEVKVNIKVLLNFNCFELDRFYSRSTLICKSTIQYRVHETDSKRSFKKLWIRKNNNDKMDVKMKRSDWTLSCGKCKAVGVPHGECGGSI